MRGIDEDGTLIPPAQFIEYLEESGVIRVLDLFVLEQSLAQAEQWRAAGLGTVPVAVNLSRMTLVHPSTLASVLAIQSRYPALPASALELEITERGGGIETSEFRAIVERFHACGLRLSLDDFGSQYANLPLFTNVKFDTIKIDRSLIADVADSGSGYCSDLQHASYELCGRGCGDPGAAGYPAEDRLSLCPGLLLRSASAGRRI